MKSCISTYSYHQLMKKGDFSYFDAIDATKRFGMDGVEIVLDDGSLPVGRELGEFMRALTSHARRIGLEIPIFTTGAELLGNDPEAEVARLCRYIDLAADCGIHRLRHDITFSYPAEMPVKLYQSVISSVAPYVRRIAEYGAARGVVTCSENHGEIMQDSYRMEALLAEVGHPNYKLLCDVGNFVCADENFATACGKLFPMAVHVHVKDLFCRAGDRYAPGEGWIELRSGSYVRPTVLGHGDVPIYQILRALKRSGYDGFVSIEFEGMEDVLDALRISSDNLKRMLADIERSEK